MANQKIIYSIDFEVNQKKIKQLQSDLVKISQIKLSDFMKSAKIFDVDQARKQLNDIQNIARFTGEAIAQSFNPKLNTVNIEQFKQKLKESGVSLEQIRQKMEKLGPEGKVHFAKLENAIYKVGKATKQSHKLLEKMGTTLANSIKWAASSALINGFTRSIQQAWGFSKSLDASLNSIRIVTGKNSEQMEKFAKKANEASFNLGKTTTDYTNAALIYAQQGLSDKQIDARTETTLKVANVTGQSAQQVSEELTSVWNGYKVSADEAEIYIDRLAAVAANSASSLQELSVGMSKVAAAAASLGVGEDQLAAQLSTIISVTRQAPETVGTALKTVYARITDIKAGIDEDGTTLGQYSGKLAEMGINVLDVSGNMRNMGTVIEEVGEKWDTFSKEQQIYIAQTMAGQRQYSNLIALFDNFDKYNKSMQIAGNAAGTLQEQQDIYMDGIEAHLNQLTNAKEKFFKSFTDTERIKPLIDVLTNLTSGATTFIEALGGGPGLLQVLGTIGVTVLGDKIGKSLQTTISNFANARLEASNLKSQIDTVNKSIENYNNTIAQSDAILNDSNASDAAKTSAQAAKEKAQSEKETAQAQKEVYEMRQKYAGFVSDDDINKLQEMVENVRILKAEMEAAQEEKQSFENNINTYMQGLKQEDIEKNGENNTVLTTSQKIGTNQGENLQAYNQNEEISQQVLAKLERQKQEYSKVSESLHQFSEDVKSSLKLVVEEKSDEAIALSKDEIENFSTQAKKALENLEKDVKFGLISKEDIENAKKYQQALQKAAQSDFKDLDLSKVRSDMQGLVRIIDQTKDNVDQLHNQVDSGSVQTQEAINNTGQAIKAQEENIKDFQQTLDMSIAAKNLTDISIGFTQIGTSMGQIKNLGDIWGSNASTGEKIIKTLIAGTTGIAGFVSGWQKLSPVMTKGNNDIKKGASSLTNLTSKHKKAKTQTEQTTKAVKKNAQAHQQDASAAGQQAAAVGGANAQQIAGAPADTVRTGTLAGVAGGFKLAAAAAKSFIASLGPIGWITMITTAISAIVAIFDGLSSAQQEQEEQAKESREATIELAHSQLQAAQSEETFYNETEKLYQQYEEGIITREQLKTSIQELGEEYEIEAGKVEALKNGYVDFYGTLSQLRQNSFISGKIQADVQTQNRVENIDTDKLSKYTDLGDEIGKQGVIKYSVSYQDEQVLKKIGGVRNANAEDRKKAQSHYYNEANDEHKWGKWAANILALGSAGAALGAVEKSTAWNQANANWSDRTILRQVNLQDKNEVKKEYGAAQQRYNKMVEYGASSALLAQEEEYISKLIEAGGKDAYESDKAAAEQLAGLLVNRKLKGLNSAENAKDYSIIVQELKAQIQSEYGDLSEADQNMMLDKQLKSFSKENYNKFQSLMDIAKQANLELAQMDDQTQQMFSNLDSAQLAELMSLDPMILKDWDTVKNTIQAISETKIPTPFNVAEIDAAATNYQKIADVVEKVKSGKTIGKKDFDELQIDDEIKKKFFRQGLNGYEMIGDQKEFEQAMLIQQAGTMGNLASGSQIRMEQNQARYENVGKNQEAYKIAEENINKFEIGDYTTDEDASTLQVNASKNMLELLKQTDFGLGAEGQSILNNLTQQLNEAETNDEKSAIYDLIRKYYDEKVTTELFNSDKIIEEINKEKENAEQAARLVHQAYFPTDSDLKDSDIYNLSNIIKESAENSEDLGLRLKWDTDAAQDLAEQILRFDNGVQDVVKNADSWQEALSNGSLTSVDAIRDAYGDIFDIQEEALSSDFVTNQSNIKLLQDAALGSKQAYIQLQEAIQNDLINSAKNSVSNIAQFDSYLNAITDEVEKINIGDTLNIEFIDALIKMLNEAGKTKDEINNIFKGMQVDVDLRVNADTGEILRAQGSTVTKSADYELKWKNLSESAKTAAQNLKEAQEKQVDLKNETKDQRDFYHDINIELERINSQLTRAQKIQKRLYGKDLIENLNKQQDILNQQIASLKKKQEIQKQDLQYKASKLAQKGVSIDQNGEISNYMEAMTTAQNGLDAATNYYNSLASAYNASTDVNYKEQLKNEMDKANTEITKKSTALSDLKTAISDYDSVRKDFESNVDKIDDAVQKLININIQKFKMQAELSLDLGKSQRQWNEFKRNVLQHDNIILTTSFQKTNRDANQSLSDATTYFESGEIDAYTRQVKGLMNSINNINTLGQDKIYGDNKAQALKDAQDAQEKLMDQLKSVQEAMDNIDQAYLDTIDNIHQIYDLQQQAYQTYGEQLQHDLDLVTLLYGDKNYQAMNVYYDKMHKNNVNQLDFLKKTKQENYQRWKQAQALAEAEAKKNGEDSETAKKLAADVTKFKEAYLQNVTDINSLINESIQLLQTKYTSAINEIFDEMEKTLTKGKGFSYLDTEWGLMTKKANLYLDTVNSAFAIKNTEFAFQQALNDTKGLKSQQKIKKVMEEQLSILKDKDKLTQYDVDRANKVLEIEKARIALEEARNNKTTMRLKRDSQGNYSYQFTADQNQIDQAQNNLAKAENDLYNFDKQQYENNLKSAYDTTKEYLSKRQELQIEYATASEERQAQITEELKLLDQEYNDYIQSLSEETFFAQQNLLDSAVESYANSYNLNKQNFNNMSDQQKQKWLEDMVPSMKSGITDLIGSFVTNPDSFKNLVSQATDNLNEKRQEYQNGLKELEEAAGENFENIRSGVDKTTEVTKDLIEENDNLIDRMGTEYDKMELLREKGQKLKEKYYELTEQAKKAVEQFQKMWTNQQTEAINAATSAVNSVAKAYDDAATAAENFARTQASSGSVPAPKGEGDDGENKNNTTQADEDWLILSKGLIDLSNVKVLNDLSYYQGELTPYAQEKVKNFFSSGKDYGEVKKSLLPQTKNLKNDDFRTKFVTEWNKKYQTKIENFDTGGYTGNWSSKQGKLAVLHEKELVLNKDDTENMLKMLEFSRTMSELVQNNVLATLSSQKQYLNSIQQQMSNTTKTYQQKILEKQKMATQALEQQVKIEANFPSVTSHKEIEQAFSNLVNLATQKALKYNKN